MDKKKWIIVGVVAALVVGGFWFRGQQSAKAEKAAAEECLSLTDDTMDELGSIVASWNGSGISPVDVESRVETAESEWSDVRSSDLKGACKQAGEAIDDSIAEFGMVPSAWSNAYDECYFDYYCTQDPSDYGWINGGADYMNSGESAFNRAEAILVKIDEGELSAQ